MLGYGAAVLGRRYDLEVIDLNAELHFRNRRKLKPILDVMDKTRILSDALFLSPFYAEVDSDIDRYYAEIPWDKYPLVYVTPPSWFPTVPTEAVLRLSRTINMVSPESRIFFFGNSLGSWTNEDELKKNGVQTVHLNGLCEMDTTAKPVRYDLLPTPIYEHRDRYLFNLLPFVLKHGCSWGRCRFCSFCAGWNSGYLERSPKAAISEFGSLIDLYDPPYLVCRDHSLNGHKLVEFCGFLERFHKPWCGQSRADLSGKQIQALGKAGCKLIYFGLESGSDRTLRALNKGITSKQLSDFTREMHSNGIMPVPSVIIGSPGERKSDFEKTIQFFVDHRSCLEVVNAYPFLATPASELSSQKQQRNKDTPTRLLQLVQTCVDLGLKVCLGEQSIEYFLFRWICTHHLVAS